MFCLNTRFYYLASLLFLLVACQPAKLEEAAIEVQPSRIQVMLAADDFAVGTPRVPLVLFDGPEIAQNVTALQVGLIEVVAGNESATVVWDGEGTRFDDYALPYWVIYPTIPHTGTWGLLLEVGLSDGTVETHQRTLLVEAEPHSPNIGQKPPAVNNRTSADTPLEQLSSGENPLPTLYDQTVAEALGNGLPTVVMFATPAFCQTELCAPVVASLEAVEQQMGGLANLIHLEIYSDFETLKPAEEVGAWGLSSEPWTFIMDKEGKVVARLGGPASPREIMQILEPLTK